MHRADNGERRTCDGVGPPHFRKESIMGTAVLKKGKTETVLEDRDIAPGDYIVDPNGTIYGVAYKDGGTGKVIFSASSPCDTWDKLPMVGGERWRKLEKGEQFTVTI